MKYLNLSLIVLSVSLMLTACSDSEQGKQTLHQAAAIESADECHLCGMLIAVFPGPKGEIFKNGITEADSKRVHKFCSTLDMFSFYLDPENTRNVTTMYVHDMSKSPWDSPNDDYFIDARTAWYVINSNQPGAMGGTLASFSAKQDAANFAQAFGGEVLSFSQITIEKLMEE